MDGYSPIEQRLLNDFQQDFPLVSRPFLAIGDQLGITETAVIQHLQQLVARGAVSRVGPVFSPGRIGASALVALAVPPERLEAVAGWISAMPAVNHNYQREHHYNLWFVAATPDQAALDRLLRDIAHESGMPMLVLRLLEQFHIDLGFDLIHRRKAASNADPLPQRIELDATQSAIVAALQSGIALEPEPYAGVGRASNQEEDAVIRQIGTWRSSGLIKRFGIVVRHHELGYRENAMVVWDVPDDEAAVYGHLAAAQEGVTLCYRRNRQLPDWPFNLFCMVHGKDRSEVRSQIARLAYLTGLDRFASQTLFSCKRYKQCGARYVANG